VKFTRDTISAVTVRDVEPGRIRIGDDTYLRDIILTADEVLEDSAPEDLGSAQEEDIAALLAFEPDVLLLGSGWKPILPPKDLFFALARRGIGLECMDTPAACRTFNILVNEGRRPAAVLKITQ
jgi:uncharacterized protein